MSEPQETPTALTRCCCCACYCSPEQSARWACFSRAAPRLGALPATLLALLCALAAALAWASIGVPWFAWYIYDPFSSFSSISVASYCGQLSSAPLGNSDYIASDVCGSVSLLGLGAGFSFVSSCFIIASFNVALAWLRVAAFVFSAAAFVFIFIGALLGTFLFAYRSYTAPAGIALAWASVFATLAATVFTAVLSRSDWCCCAPRKSKEPPAVVEPGTDVVTAATSAADEAAPPPEAVAAPSLVAVAVSPSKAGEDPAVSPPKALGATTAPTVTASAPPLTPPLEAGGNATAASVLTPDPSPPVKVAHP